MTQPIQEPNTERGLQGLAYARDQIFRRPAPIASTGQFPWVMLRDASSVETDGSSNATYGYSIATKNFDPNDDYFTWEYVAGLDHPGFRLTVNGEGIYLLDATFNWDGVATGTGYSEANLNPSDCYDPVGFDFEDLTWLRQETWGEPSTRIRISGIISLAGGSDGESPITFNTYIYQSTGTTKFGGSEYFKLVRLQSHGPQDDWTIDIAGT